MQRWHIHGLAFLFTVVIILGGGCASGVYSVSKLPPQYAAPASVDLQALNLAGLANASVSVEVIQPGDVLDVSMINDFAHLSSTTTPVRVADDGSVTIPLVGQVGVSGLTVEQAEKTINSESIARGIFRNPSITVLMRQYRTRKVTVVGAVKKPGAHVLPRGSTSLMAALVAAEGLSQEAGTEVEIRRTDSRHLAAADGMAMQAAYPPVAPGIEADQTIKVDLRAVADGVAVAPQLHDGDVVHVMKRTLPPVHVIGLVKRPGEYPYPPAQEIRVLDALALAGGISNPVAENIMVIRRVPNSEEPVRIAVSLQAAKNGGDNLALAPGDTVSVEQTVLTATVGIIQSFVHFSLGASTSLNTLF